MSSTAALAATGPHMPSAKFWDRVAEKYAKSPIADEAAYRKKLAMTQARLRPDMRILELGCGTGSTALEHAPHVAHVLATDLSENMLAIARRKAAKAGARNVTFEQAAVETLTIADESQDAVLALSLLHLLQDREAALTKIHAMLKPGGLFVSSTVCLGDSWLKYIGLVAPIMRALGRFPYFSAFTHAQFEAEVRAAGFEIDESWRPAKGEAVFILARRPT